MRTWGLFSNKNPKLCFLPPPPPPPSNTVRVKGGEWDRLTVIATLHGSSAFKTFSGFRLQTSLKSLNLSIQLPHSFPMLPTECPRSLVNIFFILKMLCNLNKASGAFCSIRKILFVFITKANIDFF